MLHRIFCFLCLHACRCMYVLHHTHPAIIAQLDAPHWVSHPRGQQPKTKTSTLPPSIEDPFFTSGKSNLRPMAHFPPVTSRHSPCKLDPEVHSTSALSALITFGDYCFLGGQSCKSQDCNIRMLTFYICRLPLPSKRTDRRHV